MHILSANDLSLNDINKIFLIADQISSGKSFKVKKFLTLFFEKPSTRTRLSFEVAIARLGGSSSYIDSSTTHMSRGESIEDTSKILGLYSDFIAARLYNHKDIKTMAEYSSAQVINSLTDLEHPTQALADVYTMKKYKKLKSGKVAFIGDIAANTANSLMLVASKFGMKISLIGPKKYNPNSGIIKIAEENNKDFNINITDSIKEGVKDADFIYTDTFVSMGQEVEAENRKKLFAPYQLNSSVLKIAPSAKVMHCLPAHRGEEITSDILDGKQSIVWEQARNKLIINEALLVFISSNKK
ncbi:MAG: ornithine carbamoyltransferase [Candidatus Marsarchaeota archaeon]|jgi:ornithine carbamoyltransferase|nr:ornithine carbamoyltransferase [Candidatus Marsarchaeota archaeon]